MKTRRRNPGAAPEGVNDGPGTNVDAADTDANVDAANTAADVDAANTAAANADAPPDPIATRSFSRLLLCATTLLALAVAWAAYDEYVTRRPYAALQREYLEGYIRRLRAMDQPAKRQARARTDPKFQRLDALAKERQREFQAPDGALFRRAARIERLSRTRVEPYENALREPLTRWRSQVAALSYRLEQARGRGDQDRVRELEADLQRLRETPRTLRFWPDPKNPRAGTRPKAFTYSQLLRKETELRREKTRLLAEARRIHAPYRAARQQADARLRLVLQGGLDSAGLARLLAGAQRELETLPRLDAPIKQIFVPEKDGLRLDLVDRCETCHLGIRAPVTLRAEDFPESSAPRALVSHPRPDLLKQHNPDLFGCSPCHGGNGMAVTSAERAHGWDASWDRGVGFPEHVEAGCARCHSSEMVLDGAPVLSRGRELFDRLGCWGCHRLADGQGRFRFAPVADDMREVLRKRRQARERAEKLGLDIAGETDPAARVLLERRRTAQTSRARTARRETLNLLREKRMPGPSLKEARAKLRPGWIQPFLENPRALQPGGRMPRFNLDDPWKDGDARYTRAQAIAAFIWQAGVRAVSTDGVETDVGLPPDARWPRPEAGEQDAWRRRGKEAFDTRGCSACHAVFRRRGEDVPHDGPGVITVGGGFAVNLSRVGDKARYEYLARFVHDPGRRTQPYSPLWTPPPGAAVSPGAAGRDLGPEDYRAAGLPWPARFSEGDVDPQSGTLLQTRLPTVMPTMRLDWAESRAIAWYLSTLRSATLPPPAEKWMDDPALFKPGKRWARDYGCQGCHEIAGLEGEPPAGMDLSALGSQPLDRFDFGPASRDARDGTISPRLWDYAAGRWGPRPPSLGGKGDPGMYRVGDSASGRAPSRTPLEVVADPRATFGQLWEARARDAAPDAGPPRANPDLRARRRLEWRTRRDFIEHKLRLPRIFDFARERTRPSRLRSKMPDYRLTEPRINALATALLGAVEPSSVPAPYRAKGGGATAAIRRGWWVIKKYGCESCHAFEPGARPALWNTPVFDENEWNNPEYSLWQMGGEELLTGPAARPPDLVGEGASSWGGWLRGFLRDPSRAGAGALRPSLRARMPTYPFSDGEIDALERFFAARSRTPAASVAPSPAVLSAAEIAAAREVVRLAGCTQGQCHGVAAPSFEGVGKRRRPDWMQRWMVDPHSFAPLTRMKPGMFTKAGAPVGATARQAARLDGPWLVSPVDREAWPAALREYRGDHAALTARYLSALGTGILKDEWALLRRMGEKEAGRRQR